MIASDGQYVAPLIQTANYHAETADTYLYAFSYSTQSESTTQDNEDVQVRSLQICLHININHKFLTNIIMLLIL